MAEEDRSLGRPVVRPTAGSYNRLTLSRIPIIETPYALKRILPGRTNRLCTPLFFAFFCLSGAAQFLVYAIIQWYFYKEGFVLLHAKLEYSFYYFLISLFLAGVGFVCYKKAR